MTTTRIKSAIRALLLSVALVGCAGVERSCSSCNASSFGGDWIVVQFGASGAPFNCWKLSHVSVDNEPHTDGIYWQDGQHLVHVSGWYNRVQVEGGRWEEAAGKVGVVLAACRGGAYVAPSAEPARVPVP